MEERLHLKNHPSEDLPLEAVESLVEGKGRKGGHMRPIAGVPKKS